jgi:hypothetical protein
VSFTIQARRLFTIQFVDEANENETLTGFRIRPIISTRQLLENHQLIFREQEGGCQVFYLSNPLAVEPLLGKITQRVRFSFLLIQTEQGFFDRYDPKLTTANGRLFYLDNRLPNGDLQPNTEKNLSTDAFVKVTDAMDNYPQIFYLPVDMSGGSPVTVSIKDKFNLGNEVFNQTIQPFGSDLTSVKIDLSTENPGLYELDVDLPGIDSKNIYIDDELAGIQAQGLVDIYWETPQDNVPPDTGVNYQIAFKKNGS